jgi:class 3 adenylate cyclase
VLEDSGFVSYSSEDGLIHDRVRGITQDHLGNMWFGTQKGVTRFDGLSFKSFTEANGLSDDRIRYILTDRTGNLWFGTFFGGICRYSGTEFIHFTEKDGISSNQVLSVFNNYDGDIWLGTLEGITELIPNVDGSWEVKSNPLEIDFSGRQVNCVVGSKDSTIWIGTDRGVYLKKGEHVAQLKTDGTTFMENTKAIFFEGDSAIWIGSDEGATRFIETDEGFRFDQYHSMPSVYESEVSSIVQDAFGRIWIAYLNSSVVIFHHGEFSLPPAPMELKNVVTILPYSENELWFATEGNGIFWLEADSEIQEEQFHQIGTDQGLSSSGIHQLIFDGQGRLWAGTASGLDRIELTAERKVKNVVHFGSKDGFAGTETNENATCLDFSGCVWFGTIGGATRYDPMAEPITAVEPQLNITKVSLEFDDLELSRSEFADTVLGFFKLPQNLTLPYHLNGLRIAYNGIDLRAPHRVRYQWKLEGYHNDEWSLIDDQNSVVFTNLNPKTYTFKVRAVGSTGAWNAEPVSFQFTVLAPFWMKWWFIALCAILFVLLIWGIIKQRERIYIKREEQLQQKVDERTFQLRQEKERSDELLLNILPYETAEELKEKGYASVQQYDKVSVLFTDFVGFTNITEGISHQELVKSLDEHFRMFDEVMDKYGIEKIKTIGDAYMAAGGIPTRTITNPLSVVAAGLEMVYRLTELNRSKELKGEKAWQLRLGIHTGSVISGVVGKNKFAFDIWGDAVNTAARMESSGEVMKVNVSGSTYELIKDHFECTPRGKIKAKNKGEIEMYFVDRLKPQFSQDEAGFTPNATFMAIVTKESEKNSILS